MGIQWGPFMRELAARVEARARAINQCEAQKRLNEYLAASLEMSRKQEESQS